MKLSQFVCIIYSFNPTDFEKKLDNQYGRIAILSWIYIVNGLNPVDFEMNLTISKEKVAIFPQLLFSNNSNKFHRQLRLMMKAVKIALKSFNPLPDDKFQTLPNWKSLQTTIPNLTKIAEKYPNG